MAVNPTASHLFIVNPLSGNSVMRLFSTHLPIADRVQRLRSMRRTRVPATGKHPKGGPLSHPLLPEKRAGTRGQDPNF